jgi:hypothetical protein
LDRLQIENVSVCPSQVKRMGVLGLIGNLVFGAGYLIVMRIQVIAAAVLPALAMNTGGTSTTILPFHRLSP